MDPKYSMWISTDPALGDYIPKAPINEEAKKHNQNLPGMGGVFNHINGDLYAYAGNNPVKYTDPDGNELDISNLKNEELKAYKVAREELLHTPRGAQIITKLESSEKIFKIRINDKGENGYSPRTRTIHWDPKKILISGDCKEISSKTLLLHELGHAYQDNSKPLSHSPSFEEKCKIENENVFLNEMPVAKQREEGLRQDYYDWICSVRNGNLLDVNANPKGSWFYNIPRK